jgi:two-component system, OmpR family, sensor kinase
MFRSLRLRLTAWYLLFFAALLMAFCGFLYALLARHLHQRLDTTLMADATTAVGLVQDEILEHQGDVPAAIGEVANEIRANGTLIAVFEKGRLLGSGDPRTAAGLTGVVAANSAVSRPFTLTLPGRRGTQSRAAVLQFASGGHPYLLLALVSLAPTAAQLQELRRVFYIALPLALVVAGIGGFLLAAKSLAPLVAMSEQTARIGDKNLHERLQIGHPSTELSQLAAAFNDLLERLDRSFETMRRFMADASHELRTPLAVIRGETDVALSQERCADEYRGSLETIREEAKRLSLLVDDLLNLARADAGHRPLRLEEFYLDDLIQECCRSVEALAAHKRIEVSCSCPEDVGFRGDQELMRRLIVNLLDNGIRYTPEGGAVSVRVETQEARIRLMVSDTGRGIPPESAERIFERFYRADQSRSRGDGGFGLGLPIAKWVAESHRGTLELSSTSERGSTFTVSLDR